MWPRKAAALAFPPGAMATIPIRVNGQDREIPAGCTVLGLLESLALNPERVAVELNRQIVRRPAWATTVLEPGAEVEIVHFVGGG